MIKKVLGPPGTGKTFTLLEYVDSYLEKGIPIDKIGYFAFTKKAATTAKKRMIKKHPEYKQTQLKYFQTLHSFCFHTLGLREENVMQPEHYEDLGRLSNIRSDNNKRLRITEESNGYLTSNSEYFQVINKASVKDIPIQSEFNTNEYSRKLDYQILKHLEVNLANYKDKNKLIDYTDMIKKYIKEEDKSPTFEVIFIDEAQDLSPIQWQMFDVLLTKTKDIFLAGDDDQAIFTWAGADVKRFIEQPAENQFLEQSVRVPKVVQEISNVILSRIQGPKIKKKYLPSDEEGTQQQIYSLDNVDLLKDKWLILVRTNTILERIEEQLRAKNLYYLTKKNKSYNGRLFRNILNWTRWTKGENLNVTECQDIFEYLDFKFDDKKLGTSISIEDAGFNKNQTWFDAFTKASNEEKLYIRAMLSNGEKLSQDARIELSTIHVAKGGEEQNVIVVLDNARKIRQAVEHNTDKQDEEHRVWYVAVTRTAKNLYFLKSKIERNGYII